MDRRAFVTGAAALLAEPLLAEAPFANKVARIGYLGFGFHAQLVPMLDAFREGLRERGWVERQDYVIEFRRWAQRERRTVSRRYAKLRAAKGNPTAQRRLGWRDTVYRRRHAAAQAYGSILEAEWTIERRERSASRGCSATTSGGRRCGTWSTPGGPSAWR